MTTTTTPRELRPRTRRLPRDVAMRLAATEYDRLIAQLRGLPAEGWSAPTECPGWDVRAMAAHLLGMVEMAASLREQRRQIKRATAAGGVLIDALTALQVDERREMTPAQLVDRLAARAPRAARARRRTPGFIRGRTLPHLEHVNGVDEPWTIGYLVDVVLTRDPWMHRIDIARASGAPLVHTADHDGVLVDDVVAEWAERHGSAYTLELSGPAGGRWSRGSGGPAYHLDVVEFCRIISGRARGEGLLTTEVPF